MSTSIGGHLTHVLSPLNVDARADERVSCETPVELRISVAPERFLRLLLQIIGVLCALSLSAAAMAFNFGHRRLFGFADQFNMNREGNVPSWYSSMTILAAAGLLSLVARAHQRRKLPFVRQFRALALIFVLLSLDEACSFHEMMFFQSGGRSVFHYAWVIAAIPMVAALGLAYLRLLMWLPSRTGMLFVASGSLFVGGALGMEMIDGWWASVNDERNLRFALLTTLEEAMEMGGIALFVYANLDYLRELHSRRSTAIENS